MTHEKSFSIIILGDKMIKREHYIENIREFYDSDLIKVITGIRRCGKSVILEQIMDEINTKSNNIIYLTFEDKKTLSSIYNGDKLIEYIEKHRKNGKCYIFLDEIQEIDDWNEACKTLRLHDNSIFNRNMIKKNRPGREINYFKSVDKNKFLKNFPCFYE